MENLQVKLSVPTLYYFFFIGAMLLLAASGLYWLHPQIALPYLCFIVCVISVECRKAYQAHSGSLRYFEGKWAYLIDDDIQPIQTPEPLYLSAWWVALRVTVEWDGRQISRICYFTPQSQGDDRFRWLCRFYAR